MNIENDAEPNEPPGSGKNKSLSGPADSSWAPWTIEFNLQDLIGGSLDSDDVSDTDSPIVCDFLADHDLSLDVFRSAISATLQQHDISSAEVSVALVSGPTMRRLNQQYLQHDFDTDVLSFCLSDPESPDLLTQLIVSFDYAKSQVEKLRYISADYSVNDELSLYLVHGSLHTLGYDDHEEDDRLEMRQAERDILATIEIVPCWPDEDSIEGAADE